MKKLKLTLIAGLFTYSAAHAQLPGLTITGNPQAPTGATWTFQDTVNSVWYDLQGILFEPPTGTPPFPAVIINHGTGGNVSGYSTTVALEMVQWGFVCIATNLCHSGSVPIGSPGDGSIANYGASTNNYLRDMKCWDILASLNYVDTNCIMSFGHSRGALTTTGLVASYPDKFSCAGHTAGGATTVTGTTYPTTTLAAQVTCPYIIHHGDVDFIVPISYDSTLNNVFNTTGIPHQFIVYPGLNHPQSSLDPQMFLNTKNWFLNYTCLATSITEISDENSLNIFPNPAQNIFTVEFPSQNFSLEISDCLGRKIYSDKNISYQTQIECNHFPDGIYFVQVSDDGQTLTKKIIIHQ